MSRFFKKLTHKYEFLKLELEETEELLEEYSAEWSKLFGKYFVDNHSEFWVNEDTGEVRKDKPEEEEPVKATKEQKSEKLKKLYKKLSTYTHPDKGGNVDDFNTIKGLYDDDDILELLKYAGLYQIDFTLDDEDQQLIEKSCTKIQSKIEASKSTMAWAYFTGDKRKKLAVIKMLEAYIKKEIRKEDYPPELLED